MEEWCGERILDVKVDLKYELLFNDSKKWKIEVILYYEFVRDIFLYFWVVLKFDELYCFIDYWGKIFKKLVLGKCLYIVKNIKMGYLCNEFIEYLSEEDYKFWMICGFFKINDIFFVIEGYIMGCVVMNDIGFDIVLV